MTIDTIRLGMPIAQALRVKADHYPDDGPRRRRRCVACGELWFRLLGLVRLGCRARRTSARALNRYHPSPTPAADAVTAPPLPPWPVVHDVAPAAPPMRAEPRPAPASRPWTGDGHTSDTAVTADLRSAFGGYRGPHARPDALDETAELPALVAA